MVELFEEKLRIKVFESEVIQAFVTKHMPFADIIMKKKKSFSSEKFFFFFFLLH